MTYYGEMIAQTSERRTVEMPEPQAFFAKEAFPAGTKVKFFTANLSDPKSKGTLEELLTTSLRCQGLLRANGDVVVISESGTFDKDGCYNVMIKYFEYCAE